MLHLELDFFVFVFVVDCLFFNVTVFEGMHFKSFDAEHVILVSVWVHWVVFVKMFMFHFLVSAVTFVFLFFKTNLGLQIVFMSFYSNIMTFVENLSLDLVLDYFVLVVVLVFFRVFLKFVLHLLVLQPFVL